MLRIVNSPMRSNRPAEHIETIATEKRVHRDAMIAALQSRLPEARLRVPQGGYFLLLKPLPQCSAEQFSELAIAHGVDVTSGHRCFTGTFRDSFLRFSYSGVPPEQVS